MPSAEANGGSLARFFLWVWRQIKLLVFTVCLALGAVYLSASGCVLASLAASSHREISGDTKLYDMLIFPLRLLFGSVQSLVAGKRGPDSDLAALTLLGLILVGIAVFGIASLRSKDRPHADRD
jgi:ABC-type transport system involved in cytochrome c biogenesis permease component